MSSRHRCAGPRAAVCCALALGAGVAAAAPALAAEDRARWEEAYLQAATRHAPLTEPQSAALYARGLAWSGGGPAFSFEAPAPAAGDHAVVLERSFVRLTVRDRFEVDGRYFNPGERYFCVHEVRKVAGAEAIDLRAGTSACYPER